jgi:hypothetical protein
MFRIVLLTALATVLALPAPSLAKDPLLSGYAGPGGGEQVLLGGRLLGGGGGSGGSGTAATTTGTASATQGSLRAPAASGGTPTSSAPTTSSSGGKTRGKGAQASGGEARKAKGSTAAPRPIAYPTRAEDAGGFPLSAGELLVGVLALAGIAGMAAWLRRTATHGGGPGAQASA